MKKKETVEKTPRKLNKTQAFEIVRVKRSQILEHPRNPREITDRNKTKLETGIRGLGMLAPITVSKRTMYILGGHKRIDRCDVIEKYDHKTKANDYELDVAMVDLTPKQELAAIVLLNNRDTQGFDDPTMLASVLKDIGKENLSLTGFDDLSLEVSLGSLGEGLFSVNPSSAETAKELHEMGDARREEIEAAKKRKKAIKADANDSRDELDTEKFVAVVFKNRTERNKALERLGVLADTRYLPASEFTISCSQNKKKASVK